MITLSKKSKSQKNNFIATLLLCLAILFGFAKEATADYDLFHARGIKITDSAEIKADYSNLKIKGTTDPVISIPTINLNPKTDYVLHIEAKSSNPHGILEVQWKADDKQHIYPNAYIPLNPKPGFHVYEIDMRTSAYWDGDVTNVTLRWYGFNDDIEIKKILLTNVTGTVDALRMEAKNLFMPFAMTPLTTNFTESSYVLGLSAVTAANLTIMACSLILLTVYLLRRCKNGGKYTSAASLRAAIALIVLAAWLILDVRESISERRIQKAASISNAKSIYVLNDFHSFAAMARKHTDKSFAYALFSNVPDTFHLHSRYLLYPAKAAANAKEASVILVYNIQTAAINNGVLYINNAPVANGAIAERFNEHSFIFVPEGGSK